MSKRNPNRVGVKRMESGVVYRDQAIPVSRTMPIDPRPGNIVNRYGHKVREHSDGTLSTMDGKRIVDSEAARAKHMLNCGYIKHEE